MLRILVRILRKFLKIVLFTCTNFYEYERVFVSFIPNLVTSSQYNGGSFPAQTMGTNVING